MIILASCFIYNGTIHTFFAEQHESKTGIMAAVSCKTQKSAEPEDPADDFATG